MATHYYYKNDNYDVIGNSSLSVAVISGNGQGGGCVIFKGAEFLGANEEVKVGKSADCKGKDLRVIVNIQDKLDQTNWTGVIVVIQEAGKITKFSYAEELPVNLDIACYNITIAMS